MKLRKRKERDSNQRVAAEVGNYPNALGFLFQRE